jgi:hypothetical protein
MSTLRSRLLLVAGLAGCAHGQVSSNGFSGRAPEPTLVVAPLDCVSAAGRDRDLARIERALGDAFVARFGEDGIGRAGGGTLCADYGVRQPMFGHTPDSAEVIGQLAEAASARSVLVPVVQRDDICHPTTRAIRDEGGAPIGSIDTGASSCAGGATELRLYLFDRVGTLLWRKWQVIRGNDALDVDKLRALSQGLVADVPVSAAARPAVPAQLGLAAPRAATPSAAAPPADLPASAPPACVKTWKHCDGLREPFPQQCRAFVINAVTYAAANAASNCQMYDRQIDSFAAH